MGVIIYHEEYNQPDALENFLDLLYSSQMNHLASDLLDRGLSPLNITSAVKRAIAAMNAAGLPARQHFAPVYTQYGSTLVKDCKLTRLGYSLVLLNADVNVPSVAEWQLRLIKDFMK